MGQRCDVHVHTRLVGGRDGEEGLQSGDAIHRSRCACILQAMRERMGCSCDAQLCWDDVLGKGFTSRGCMDNDSYSTAMGLPLDATVCMRSWC